MKIMILYTITFLSIVFSHCQIPCGIFDDIHRVLEIDEHIKTIDKSINFINSLSEKLEKEPHDMNQIVRWINTKEDHSIKIQNLISDYFLAQRIKPKDIKSNEYDKYIKLVTACHKIIYFSMKLKQNVDTNIIKELKNNLNLLVEHYFNDEQKKYLRESRK